MKFNIKNFILIGLVSFFLVGCESTAEWQARIAQQEKDARIKYADFYNKLIVDVGSYTTFARYASEKPERINFVVQKIRDNGRTCEVLVEIEEGQCSFVKHTRRNTYRVSCDYRYNYCVFDYGGKWVALVTSE